MSRDPPLFAGSILGLRAWLVEAKLPSAATRLGSTFAAGSWEPGGRWTEAACRPRGSEPGNRHDAPGARCSCGLYALHPRAEVAEALFDQHVGLEGSPELHDPCLVEMVGPLGVVEACGRIEVHESGFRAERARPLALVAGRHWPRAPREAIAELAALYGAEVLEVAHSEDLLEYCRERGGTIAEEQLERLLEGVERPDAAGRRVAPAPPPPPPPPPTGLARTWTRSLELLGNAALVLIAVLWYGFWLVAAVAGGLLFGWFDEEPRPAKLVELRIDRQRCELRATISARRRLERLNVVVSGNLRNGDPLGSDKLKLGPIRRGRSELALTGIAPRLCRSRHHFAVRARPVWKGFKGRAVEDLSRFRGAAGGRGPPEGGSPDRPRG